MHIEEMFDAFKSGRLRRVSNISLRNHKEPYELIVSLDDKAIILRRERDRYTLGSWYFASGRKDLFEKYLKSNGVDIFLLKFHLIEEEASKADKLFDQLFDNPHARVREEAAKIPFLSDSRVQRIIEDPNFFVRGAAIDQERVTMEQLMFLTNDESCYVASKAANKIRETFAVKRISR